MAKSRFSLFVWVSSHKQTEKIKHPALWTPVYIGELIVEFFHKVEVTQNVMDYLDHLIPPSSNPNSDEIAWPFMVKN